MDSSIERNIWQLVYGTLVRQYFHSFCVWSATVVIHPPRCDELPIAKMYRFLERALNQAQAIPPTVRYTTPQLRIQSRSFARLRGVPSPAIASWDTSTLS